MQALQADMIEKLTESLLPAFPGRNISNVTTFMFNYSAFSTSHQVLDQMFTGPGGPCQHLWVQLEHLEPIEAAPEGQEKPRRGQKLEEAGLQLPLTAHSLPFPKNAESSGISPHTVVSAEPLNSPSEEDMGTTFQVIEDTPLLQDAANQYNIKPRSNLGPGSRPWSP
ncbi:hypothetical protein HPG69_013342 [Diceros bicornis minor]|uniref:Ral guanine nucleotide dissociation stimulator-like n=1 Tax=Diceros bicornis minor TaxID=77932 RepID=A0A7J7E3U4_DICBM|nr:hypothetical protein HPG69_013342 [Diceros bicornis minor]